MNKEQFAIYEKTPQHGKDYNGVILAPFNTKEEAEIAGKKYGYYGDNYYADILDYNKKSRIMNKEQQELLDEAYEVYLNGGDIKWLKEIEINTPLGKMNMPVPYSKEEFINKCKTDTEFSQKWELKIEERELSLEERLRLVNYDKQKFSSIDEWIKWYENEPNEFYYLGINYTKDTALTDLDVPTKLITIAYKDKTIETYYDGRTK